MRSAAMAHTHTFFCGPMRSGDAVCAVRLFFFHGFFHVFFRRDIDVCVERVAHLKFIVGGAPRMVRQCRGYHCQVQHREFWSLRKLCSLRGLDKTVWGVLTRLGETDFRRYVTAFVIFLGSETSAAILSLLQLHSRTRTQRFCVRCERRICFCVFFHYLGPLYLAGQASTHSIRVYLGVFLYILYF